MQRTILLAGSLFAMMAWAQEDIPTIDPSQLTIRNGQPAVMNNLSRTSQANGNALAANLRTWPYQMVSPRDGNIYTGTIVGYNPFNNGARTATIPVRMIPVRVQFTGTVRNFDPTQPDNGCLGIGNTAMSLIPPSPVFSPVNNYLINGENMGNATFIDAFQRAEFWPTVYAKNPAYHIALSQTANDPMLTVTVANSTVNGQLYGLGGSPCGTNANVSGATNPGGVLGVVNINFLDPILQAYNTTLGVTADQFPLYVIYGMAISGGDARIINNCCILGYHNGSGVTLSPGQTYGISQYARPGVFGGDLDIATMSHEVLEWINDPSVNNLVPIWGNIGQVGPCPPQGTGQDNLETGDPLSGILMPGVLMGNGVTYHPQENAFFGWFMGGPGWPATSGPLAPYPTGSGAGKKYSSNGTFSGFARNPPLCGTN